MKYVKMDKFFHVWDKEQTDEKTKGFIWNYYN